MKNDDRSIAWAEQMQAVHDRLREALALADEGLDGGSSPQGVDLLLHCWGFCTALAGHHSAEDSSLFPALLADRPGLTDVVSKLVQDHSLIEHLLAELQSAMARDASPESLRGHLDGVSAIMESHFRYEERELLGPLAALALDAKPEDVLGPLA